MLKRWLALLCLILTPSAFAFDLDTAPETTIRLTPTITFGGQIALQHERKRNFDLDRGTPDGVSLYGSEISLSFDYRPAPRFQAFLNATLAGDVRREENAADERGVQAEIEEAFVVVKDGDDGRLFLQAGRQPFDDDRQWLYDTNLDGVRAFYRQRLLTFELAAARARGAGFDPKSAQSGNGSDHYLARGTYAPDEESEFSVYLLSRQDRPGRQAARPIFFGLHADGEVLSGVDSWLEIGAVGGRDGEKKIRGIGFDVGATIESEHPFSPALSLDYAFGTGDGHPTDGVDRNFRQTGLHENDGAFSGLTRFKYYGEVFDPTLSNLGIASVGVGLRPDEAWSIDWVYHLYRQHRAVPVLRDAGIEINPNGRSLNLGSEIDMIVGGETARIEWKWVIGYFMPGSAFPSDTADALLVSVEGQIRF